MAESARVVVGVSGSLSSLGALHRAVELARERNAVLVPVLAWHPVGGEYAYRSAPCPQLLKVWEEAARERLDSAFEQCFGGYPAGVRVRPMLVRDENPGRALVAIADRPGDVLVVSTGRQGRLHRVLRTSVGRYCLAHAHCLVVAVPPSELLNTLEPAADQGAPMTLPSGWNSPATAA
ncbi:universal stress protein [Streptacidiphilus sp. P02-A3a]|uniref:universal stress protein n=1 Tax=Streptacidiphilus sp. P02-A3a TaxID=2704468 RepID=UPI0015F82FCF|nr:universal stress protein [Streptacidiphilus sp. P02-A3a]QMU71051.1 universal stress protein [Streptacidiphilus sp. P02-A3a]